MGKYSRVSLYSLKKVYWALNVPAHAATLHGFISDQDSSEDEKIIERFFVRKSLA
jgi:hypothetical protein